MKSFKRLSLGLVAGLLLSSVSAAIPTASATRTSWGCWKVRSQERSFTRKMKTARSNREAPKIHLDPQLSKVARHHSWVMARENSMFHSSPKKLSRRVTRWRTLGENVGMGDTVSSLHRAFMHSRAHRKNILSGTFKHVGVGTVEERDTIFVTVVFESERDPGTRLRPPGCRS